VHQEFSVDETAASGWVALTYIH